MLRLNKSKWVGCFLFILPLILFGACSSDTDESVADVSNKLISYPDQLDIEQVQKIAAERGLSTLAGFIEDGVVTRAEYERAHAIFNECSVESGVLRVIGETLVNPLDASELFTQTEMLAKEPTQEQSDAYNRCLENYEPAKSLYQRMLAESEKFVAPDLYEYISECLTKAGWQVNSNGRTLSQMVEDVPQKDAEGDKVLGCATAGMNELYPEFPIVSVGY